MLMSVNGQIIPAEQARISAADRGFTLGDGLFETIKLSRGRLLRLDAHLNRLRQGTRLLRLPLATDDALETALAALLHAAGLDDAVLRLTVSRGVGQRGLLPPDPCQPTVTISIQPLPTALPPARAVVATRVRRNQFSPLAGCKSTSYLDNVLARMEAQDKGADDAILLNTHGQVAETTIANLFIVAADGIVVTPPVADGALPGVRRAELLCTLAVEERSLAPTDVLSAREAFLTNALGVRPLIALDGNHIGDGQPGTLSRRLQEEVTHE